VSDATPQCSRSVSDDVTDKGGRGWTEGKPRTARCRGFAPEVAPIPATLPFTRHDILQLSAHRALLPRHTGNAG